MVLSEDEVKALTLKFSLQVWMELAKDLLPATNNTLQMIGEAVGYKEGTNFQNMFKRTIGCTPGEWRRKQTP